MALMDEQLIWFPGLYRPRLEEEYTRSVADATLSEIVETVTKRATEDGEYCIENGLVGDNEDKMRRMMAFVCSETNIQQCTSHIYREDMEYERSLDWVCRELALASKRMVR